MLIMGTTQDPNQEDKPSASSNSIAFAAVVTAYQVLVCVTYGIVFTVREDILLTYNDYGGVLLITILTMMVVVGFGLINAYVVKSSITGLTYSLLLFVLSIQTFFLFRVFWERVGTSSYSKKFEIGPFEKIMLSNYGNDRQEIQEMPSAPIGEAIACALSLIIALGPLIGRIKLVEVFLLSVFGTACYEVNSQLIWRWYITDNAFGFRCILFGAVLGLAVSLMLGDKNKTFEHPNYYSDYKQMSLGMLGFLFVWVCFPFMAALTTFTNSTNDNAILYTVVLNMVLAMVAGVLGTFSACSIIYRKFSMFDLIFTGTAGGFAYASSADINWNPAGAMITAFVTGFICTLISSSLQESTSSNGLLTTLPQVQRFLVPGLVAGVISAIVQACNVSVNGMHPQNRDMSRTPTQQGAQQLLGIAITIGLAFLSGILMGIPMKLMNRKTTEQEYFNDKLVFRDIPKKADAVRYDDD